MPNKKPPRTKGKLISIIKEYLSGLEGKATNFEELKQLSRAPQKRAEEEIQYHLELIKAAESADENPAKKQKLANNPPINPNIRANRSDTGLRLPNQYSEYEKFTKIPTENYDSLAGIDDVIQDVTELIEYPITHPEIYKEIGTDPPHGILLYGPPGCGKTLLAHCIAGNLQVPLVSISAPQIVSGMSGESEGKLRLLFEYSKSISPCILFIDELDAIITKRGESQRGMDIRIVAQLSSCMDNLANSNNNRENDDEEDENNENNKNSNNNNNKTVIVIGATNRPDALDNGLRRPGRFDKEICLGVPTKESRLKILQKLCSRLKIEGSIDFNELAFQTAGYVGADLVSLVYIIIVFLYTNRNEAGNIAVNRIFKDVLENQIINEISQQSPPESSLSSLEITNKDENDNNDDSDNETPSQIKPQKRTRSGSVSIEVRKSISQNLRNKGPLDSSELEKLYILMEDFVKALKKVQPSAQREGFATKPNVTWEDVGSLKSIRKVIDECIVYPIKHPEIFKRHGISMPAGILLYGPPGCGKTLLAKAVANESGANFISVKGPELLTKYVGESEKAVRQVFVRARASNPCVIFFDELDALCPIRDSNGKGDSGVSERVVNQLLTEMDGLEKRGDVFVIAATNRVDMIDHAMLRPGRLDKKLYVPLPEENDRYEILKTLTRHSHLEEGIDLDIIAKDKRCEGFSGADLQSLVREATLTALRPALEQTGPIPDFVTLENFKSALDRIKPSVSKLDKRAYEEMKKENDGI